MYYDIDINGYNIAMRKNSWTPEDLELALCFDFSFDGDRIVSCDIRKTAKQSLFYFFNQAFSYMMLSPGEKSFRLNLFDKIKRLYQQSFDDFMANYYPKLGYKKPLYIHQKHALALMVHRKNNLLSLDMGLGKSITTASMSKMFSIPRTIIIGPSLVKWNWFRDMTSDWGYNELYWTILDARPSKCMRAFRERFVVCNYEMIHKHFDSLVKDDTGHIIVDECHYMKNHKSLRFKGVEKIVKQFPNARITLLSGTPVTNRANDLFAYLKLTGHHLGKNHKKFMEDYTNSKSGKGGSRVSSSKNVEELNIKISNFMIRKKAEECLDLPDLIIKNYYFPMDEFSKEYDSALEILMESKRKYDESDDSGKKKESFNIKANLHTLNRIVSCAKVKNIIELAENLKLAGRKCIIFSSYTDPLVMMEKHFKKRCVRIDGSVGSHERDVLIQKFKNDDDVHVFLGNVKAAGVGINLVNACDVIFTNFPFTPDDLEQPYKRSHRIGQKDKVNVYFTFAEGTIDEQIYSLIVDKSDDINVLIDNGKTKGVINYSNIQDELFSSLIRKYKKDHNIPIEEEDRFVTLR